MTSSRSRGFSTRTRLFSPPGTAPKGASGRWWPCAGWIKRSRPSCRSWGLGYASFEDLSNLLEKARLEYSPKFAAPETDENFITELQPVAEREARRLLYVALTRARDKLVLECPWYLSSKGGTYWSILEQCGIARSEDSLRLGDEEFACAVTMGGVELPADLELGAIPLEAELPVYGRRAVQPGFVPVGLTPDSRTPSALVLGPHVAAGPLEAPALAAASVVQGLKVVRYSDVLQVEVGLTGVALGTFLHRSFEVLGARPEFAAKLPQLTGVALSASGLGQIAAAVARFEAWLLESFKPTSVQREWPLLHVNQAGTVVSGMADLIVHTADGAWIIDHKSDQIEDSVQAFLKYELQLQAYADAIAATGTRVAGVAVHWIRRGEVVIHPVGATGRFIE